MYLANIAKCREIIAMQDRDQLVSQKVEHLLITHFDKVSTGQLNDFTPPSLKRICDQVFITERTLIRRLKHEGASYKKILQAARYSCAKQLLQRVSFSVADVAEQLGYKDPANFARAFKQWAGVTPAEWRRRG
jgi:AraC-like DNA-binding protein